MRRVNGLSVAIPSHEDVINQQRLTTSQHYTKKRDGNYIKWLMLHNTEATNSLWWLTAAPDSVVSAHCLGDRQGRRRNLVDYVDTAHHAGYCKGGVSNSNSLGYEIENSSRGNRIESYTDNQMLMCSFTFAGWQYSYGLPDSAIIRHGDYAIWKPYEIPNPYYPRRTDPNAFNMERFHDCRSEYLRFFKSLRESEIAEYLF